MQTKTLQKVIIFLGLLVPIIFIGYYFLFKDIKARNERISLISQEISLQTEKQEYLITTERLIENLSSDLDRMDSYIIPSGGDVEFIESLEELARGNGLTITIDALDIVEKTGFVVENIVILQVKAQTKGRWLGSYAFLKEIESMPYKVSVSNYSIINTPDQTAEGQRLATPGANWQGSFEIQVLKYK